MPEALVPPAEATPFDDGFQPSGTKRPTTLLRQPRPATLPPGLTVLPEAVSKEVALRAYEYTSSLPEEERQWGTYLRLDSGEDAAGQLRLETRGEEPEVEALAMALLHDFWKAAAAKWLRADLRHVHGFSVWAVCGGVGMETSYHVDYAEVYRRSTNCIMPIPWCAVTWQ